MIPKMIAPAVALVLTATCATGAFAEKSSSANENMPAVMAVAFHADWCPGCKALGPKVMKVKASHTSEGVLFVKLDLTNDATKAQSAYLANALGLSKVWQENSRKTVQVLLINTKTKQVIGKLTPDLNAADIEAALKKAIAKAKA